MRKNDILERRKLIEEREKNSVALNAIVNAIEEILRRRWAITEKIKDPAAKTNASDEILHILLDVRRRIGVLQKANEDNRQANVLRLLKNAWKIDVREPCATCYDPIDGTDRTKNSYPDGLACDECAAKWEAEMADFNAGCEDVKEVAR